MERGLRVVKSHEVSPCSAELLLLIHQVLLHQVLILHSLTSAREGLLGG